MDAIHADYADLKTNARFVTKFDAIPGFWNYLIGLNRNDLIAELVQNDLDQGATRTVISFESTSLICEGNGKPVDPEGWQRLQMILGAGNEVPAKRSRFGVKNHGLKAAFTIGDEIRLVSDRRAIIQTLYAQGRNMPPYPGASEYPIQDLQAPTEGCRVIVQYRYADLEPTQGEAVKLDAVTEGEIETLFELACASMPEQFAGIVSPEVTPRYEIVLQHWKLGKVRFQFSCTRPRKAGKGIEVFRRRCTVNGTYSPLPNPLREQSVRRLVALRSVLKDRVADFFRRRNQCFIEASWPIDAKGKPKVGLGSYRYPIGYPASSREARTGHSTHFTAPFASDKERQAPAWNEATNAGLRQACESLLVDALVHLVIPRWKAKGLNPIVPNTHAEDGNEVVRTLLAALVRRGALPVLNWRQAAEVMTKGKKINVGAAARRHPARGFPKKERRYRFVVPALTWAKDNVEPLLSLLCPSSEAQVDPRVNADVVSLLADRKTPGFFEEFVTFDENDVIDRVTSKGNEYFGALDEPEREFSDPLFVRVYLDLIELMLKHGDLKSGKEDLLCSTLLLPDIDGQATRLSDLYSNASLPSSVPGLHLPPILDARLAAHALFKRSKWKVRKFTMAEFLKDATLETADEQTRRMFWKWLCRNGQHILPRDRPKFAELAIWPDENDRLCRISDLCEPRSGRVGTVLAGFIRRPHKEVRRLKLVTVGGRARTSIRRTPTEGEIGVWLDAQLTRFDIGSRPDVATAAQLRRFETDLCNLLQDRFIAPMLKAAASALPALARDGAIRLRTELVLPSGENDRLALPDRFLLVARQRAGKLAKLSPALTRPTAAMLLEAFDEDSGNFSALQPRLMEFMSITGHDDEDRRELAGKPIIPVGTQSRIPFELAFIGNKGNYWGAWKVGISTEGLSQNDQSRYRAAGVTSALPNPETSRAFFEWLATLDKCTLGQHIPCILRHFLHPSGPIRWARDFTDRPCIPARGRDGLQLVPFQFVQHKPVFLADAGDIGEIVIQKDRAVLLVIHQAKEVMAPISEPLRELGVKSLREALKEPESVIGTGNVAPVSEDILARFHRLRSYRFRQTFRKRLNELGLDLRLLRHDWQVRLDRVEELHFGEDVEVRFRFRGKSYQQKADAGFDPGTGIFWMKRGLGARGLYESVARQLIFRPTARLIDLLALERAVEMEIADPSFRRPSGGQWDAGDDYAVAGDADGTGQDGEENGGLGEAGSGHSPFEPDPKRNRPSPGPISTESRVRKRRPKGQLGSPDLSEGKVSKQTPDVEKKQVEELKRNHYASHCQMCLCARSPQELAPVGSYIESEEVRQSVVHAHHTDLVSAGGARHVGNIILLCKLHHNNYGRQLSRAGISAALRDNPKEMSVRYGEDSHVSGRQVELAISGTEEVVNLFFTDYHIEYWLSQDPGSD